MTTRREFLRAGAAGLAALPAVACRGRAASVAEPRADSAGQAVPASIAALKSMKDQAQPITNAERMARIERARRLMADNRLDAVVLMGGTSLLYFSNISWGLSERLFAMVLPAKGEPFYVSPAFEEDRAREQIALGPFAATPDLRTWQENESPYERVAQGLKDRGIASGRVGMEETVRFVFSEGIGKAAPALRIVSATPVTAGCRIVKDPHEVELMRLASKATLAAYAAAFQALHEGLTQNEFSDLIATAHARLGFQGRAGVQTGPYSANPHGSIAPQTIRKGTILLIDGGCAVEGYHSDISRTFVLGKATDKMKQVFDIVHHAQRAAADAARPGLLLETVDAAARKVITDAGYGPGFKYFTHRLGHGLGMDGHEWPYLVEHNMYGWVDRLLLEPRMVFTDEPGVYIRGEFGVRLEDDMVVTDKGGELLTPQSPSIEQPFTNVTT